LLGGSNFYLCGPWVGPTNGGGKQRAGAVKDIDLIANI